MKSFLTILVLTFTLISSNLFAQERFISSGKDYTKNEVDVVGSNDNKTTVDVRILGVKVYDSPAPGYHTIALDGYTSIANVGDASLPVIVKFVEIPDHKNVKINILNTEFVEEANINVMPQQEIPMRGSKEPPAFVINSEYYKVKTFQPNSIVQLKEIALIGDRRVAVINIFPVSFNAVSNAIKIYSDIRFELSYEGISGINNSGTSIKRFSPTFDAIYKDIILNYNGNYDNNLTKGAQQAPKLLIIVHDSLYSSAVPLAEWKTMKGYQTEMLKISELGLGMTPTAVQIKSFLTARYNSPQKADYILFIGDVTGSSAIAWHTVGFDKTDHPYACLNGTDVIPDVMVGRISVQTRASLDTVVAKLIQYEKTPFVNDQAWYKRAVVIHSNDGIDPVNAQVMKNVFMNEGGFTNVQLVNNSNSQSQITNYLNQTSSWVWFIGHGDETSWADPYWSQSNMVNLNYGLRLPQVISIACSNADLDYSTSNSCFGETFINRSKQNSAANICASTELCAFYTSDTIGRFMVYAYFRENLRDFGSMMNFGKIKAHQYFNGNSTVLETINQFMILGDPTQTTYSDVPKQLMLTNSVSGNMRTITVRAASENSPVGNAMIGISKNGELKVSGYTDSLGSFTFDQTEIAGELVKIVVTGTNLYPYVSDLMTGISSNGEIPKAYELSQNFPNPFNPATKIKFAIPQSSLVTLKIYNILGKEVASLISENLNAGNYEVDFNAAALSSGSYFYRITAGEFTSVKKMLLIK